MRPPAGPALTYRKALRDLSDLVSRRVMGEIGPLLEQSLPAVRTDAISDVRDTIKARLANIRRGLLGVGKSDSASRTVDNVAAQTVAANGREFTRVLRIDPKQAPAALTHQIERFQKENVDLIQSIPDALLDDVQQTLDKSWSAGERVETLRSKLQERFDVSKSKADLIARDQVLKLNARITQERQKAAGISEYRWVTAHDERVRGNPDGLYPNSQSDHYSLDGTRQRWDAPPVTNKTTGETNHPGEDYQCRCVAVPILSFLEDGEDDAET